MYQNIPKSVKLAGKALTIVHQNAIVNDSEQTFWKQINFTPTFHFYIPKNVKIRGFVTFSGGGEEEMKYWGEMSLWQHLFQITNKDNFVDFKTMTRSTECSNTLAISCRKWCKIFKVFDHFVDIGVIGLKKLSPVEIVK